MADSLLIIEDEALLGSELRRHYSRQGWEVSVAADLGEARRQLIDKRLDPAVVLSDMNLPDGNGLDLLDEVRKQGLGGEWVFLTGYGSVPDSVRALRLGAYDFLEKPCDQRRLDLVIAGAARSARAQRQLFDQASAQRQQYPPEAFVGNSAAARTVRDMLAKLSRVPFSALIITGDTGSGKGLAARILHHSGARSAAPLVELNCAALPRELVESQLFGHEAGAFTGAKGRQIGLLEQAHGGTLFLDEIGELEIDLQAKLLKAIEDKRIRRLGGDREIPLDVQVIAASNRDLQAAVKEGRFRDDLYHRLSVFRLHLPALRERKEDLDELVPLFVAQYNSKAGKSVKRVPDLAWEELRAYPWPGNVRELRNVVERCVLLADSDVFPVQWMQLSPRTEMPGSAPQISDDRICLPLNGSMDLEDMDRYIIKTALERHGFNVTATARALGTTRETLRYRIAKYGLSADGERT